MGSLPGWLVSTIEWAVGQALQRIQPGDVKAAFADLIESVNAALQAAEANVKGPFEGVADLVALEVDDAAKVIVAALRK